MKQTVIFTLAIGLAGRGFAETPAAPSAKTLIVPGKSIGDIVLGAATGKVEGERGKPDYTDAAMGGKESESWYLGAKRGDKGRPFHRPEEIGLFALRDMDDDAPGKPAKAIIKQIEVTSPQYATADGIAPGSTLDAIRAKFPDIQPDAADDATWPLYGEVQFYKDTKSGIVFAIRKSDGVCIKIDVMQGGGNYVQLSYPMAAQDYVIDDINGTVGSVQLGITSVKLAALLGKPEEMRDESSGFLLRWRVPSQHGRELPALCVYLRKLADGTLIVDQIRVSSRAFALTDKIFPGCPLKDALEATGNMAKIDSYNDQHVDIYGDLRAGLLFDVRQGDSVCTAIAIFPAPLQFHPDMTARWLDLPPATPATGD